MYKLKKYVVTVNGFPAEFEDEVIEAAQDKKEIGPFNEAKEAIKALRKSKFDRTIAFHPNL